MKTKPILAGILLLLVLVGLGSGLAYWKHRANKKAAEAPAFIPPEFVDSVGVETVAWRPTARLVGTVVAKRSVSLANEMVGVVREIGFDSGQSVKQGQVLVQFDTSTELADLAGAEASERLADAAIQVAEANLRAAKSSLALATSNRKRFQDAAGSVSAADLDRANSEFDKMTADVEREQASLLHARAELDQAKARVAQIKTLIAKKTLSAPFDARAGMRTVHQGQYLAEGTSIVSLTELTDDIYLDFAIPQEYAPRVVVGSVVMANSQVLGGAGVPITVVSIDATVNPSTRNIRVRSLVKNPGQFLKPGMSIDVEVPVDEAKPFLVLPTTAIRRASFGDHVFVLTPMPADPKAPPGPPTFTAHQRMVSLGDDIGGKVIVTSGLKEGEIVASSGSFKLREGALVMQGPPPGPPGAAGGPPQANAGESAKPGS